MIQKHAGPIHWFSVIICCWWPGWQRNAGRNAIIVVSCFSVMMCAKHNEVVCSESYISWGNFIVLHLQTRLRHLKPNKFGSDKEEFMWQNIVSVVTESLVGQIWTKITFIWHFIIFLQISNLKRWKFFASVENIWGELMGGQWWQNCCRSMNIAGSLLRAGKSRIWHVCLTWDSVEGLHTDIRRDRREILLFRMYEDNNVYWLPWTVESSKSLRCCTWCLTVWL